MSALRFDSDGDDRRKLVTASGREAEAGSIRR